MEAALAWAKMAWSWAVPSRTEVDQARPPTPVGVGEWGALCGEHSPGAALSPDPSFLLARDSSRS